MGAVISIREYDKLHIRKERDLSKKVISLADASYLQSVVVDNSPVFSFGNRCLIAQQYVGVIETPDFTIEILPKLYGEVDNEKLREVLVRMLLVTNQSSSIRQFKASVSLRKNSLSEIIIQSFLRELQNYVESGLQHEYKKIVGNLDKVKGQILISQQIKKNILAPTKFYCRYSKYVADNELNQFFKTCLIAMSHVSRDTQNKYTIGDLLLLFDEIESVNVDKAIAFRIEFNSINERAHDAYKYGRLFLENLHATLNAGLTEVYTMMFDMEKLYELFVYRIAYMVFGSRVTYQKKGNYLISRNSDGKKFISLRPDLTIKMLNGKQCIVDTKWKLPRKFVKESDVYQMNAYSTGIKNVEKVILLYPHILKSDNLTGQYTILSNDGYLRLIEIRFIDLIQCLDWKTFLKTFKRQFCDLWNHTGKIGCDLTFDEDAEGLYLVAETK